MNKLFTVLGGKFKFSAQDSDLEYLFWRCKNLPVSSDLNPPLTTKLNIYCHIVYIAIKLKLLNKSLMVVTTITTKLNIY